MYKFNYGRRFQTAYILHGLPSCMANIFYVCTNVGNDVMYIITEDHVSHQIHTYTAVDQKSQIDKSFTYITCSALNAFYLLVIIIKHLIVKFKPHIQNVLFHD